MAARRGCVNSLWSGTERVRIGERLKATLAGVMELEVLRCKHLEMVDAALEDRPPVAANAEDPRAAEEEEEGRETSESGAMDAEHGSATSRRQQVSQYVCQLTGRIHRQMIKYEWRADGDLPKSQSLCDSLDRFYRCLERTAVPRAEYSIECDGARDQARHAVCTCVCVTWSKCHWGQETGTSSGSVPCLMVRKKHVALKSGAGINTQASAAFFGSGP